MFKRIITVPSQPLLDDSISKRKEKKKQVISFFHHRGNIVRDIK